MLAASGSMFFASTALAAAGGNNGTVQINGQDFKNGNDPHISCPVTFKWTGFDPGVQDDYTITFTGTNPTGGTIDAGGGSNVLSGHFTGPDFTSPPTPLTITGGTPNNKGEYHVTIVVETKSAVNTDTKSKTVWLGGCGPVQQKTVTLAGQCNTNSGNYDWTLTANPAAAVSGTYSVNGGASTNYTTNAGTGVFSFNSGHSPGPVSFTVGGGVYTAANSPQTATTNHSCDAPNVVNPSATAAANCNTLSAHLVGGTNGAVFDIVHNGVNDQITVPANQTADPSYNNSAAGATITVSIGGVQKASATASNSCGGPPTPASATANADCTALTAHLDGGTNGTTFTIVEPGGTHTETVAGGATKDVSYGTGNGATISVSDGGTVLDIASAPSDCVGSAAPQVSEANHCSSGMNLTLSNMNGTADVTFTVAAPDGSTQTYTVRAGQLKKVAFAVTEDTTGALSVSAPGLAKQSFTYKKNCASVLGVKHTRKPPHKPVVEGEHAQLPFTGFDTRRALLDGAGLFFFGAVLCMLGARRKNEDYVY